MQKTKDAKLGCGGVADTARSFVTSKDRDGRKRKADTVLLLIIIIIWCNRWEHGEGWRRSRNSKERQGL